MASIQADKTMEWVESVVDVCEEILNNKNASPDDFQTFDSLVAELSQYPWSKSEADRLRDKKVEMTLSDLGQEHYE